MNLSRPCSVSPSVFKDVLKSSRVNARPRRHVRRSSPIQNIEPAGNTKALGFLSSKRPSRLLTVCLFRPHDSLPATHSVGHAHATLGFIANSIARFVTAIWLGTSPLMRDLRQASPTPGSSHRDFLVCIFKIASILLRDSEARA